MMKKLENMLTKVFAMAGVGYYDHGLFRLQLNGEGVASWKKADDSFVPRVLIVARGHYQEVSKTYPLDDRKEVIKLLKLEAQSQPGYQQHVVYPSHEGQTATNQWFFDPHLPDCKLILPESFVFGFNCPLFSTLITHFKQGQLYITRTPFGVVSAPKGGLITNTASFAMASGISLPGGPDVVTPDEVSDILHAQTVIQTLPKLLTQYPVNFLVKSDSSTQWTQELKPVLLATLVTATLYLTLSSAYLGVQGLWLDAQLDDNRDEVEQALNIQTEFNQLSAELNKQQAFISTQSIKTPFWQVIEPLMQQARFTSVRYRGERFVLIGETSKATSLLEALVANPNVIDAKFDNQVHKSRKKESFTISFQIKGGLS
ncbi:hypothetical protein [uncultured Shewanella sp.]|uniref:hypothetical protein n=1 Tax=uncultured Shewanella sp. TaxID=173975 RepID=UPI002610AF96|nr:hypothetical protein [uncultured Shewanella sp.]